jgi:hypothetical protein
VGPAVWFAVRHPSGLGITHFRHSLGESQLL